MKKRFYDQSKYWIPFPINKLVLGNSFILFQASNRKVYLKLDFIFPIIGSCSDTIHTDTVSE